MLKIFFVCLFLLLSPWAFYFLFAAFRALGIFKPTFSYKIFLGHVNPKTLIVIPVYNGINDLSSRLLNINNCCSPVDFDLLFVSDGSTDGTFEFLRDYGKKYLDSAWNFFSHENSSNIGRALTHNFVVERFAYRYYVFSDLDTLFTSSFPAKALSLIESDSSIGAVSAQVKFKFKSSHGFLFSSLFKLEVLLRKLSLSADLCMKASGPAILFERSVWETILPFEDVDHCIGFFCMSKSKRLLYDSSISVIDMANNSVATDFNARSRMTRKSILSFFHQLSVFDLFSPPRSYFCLFGYILHKPLRFFLVPVLVISMLCIQNYYLPYYLFIPLLLLQVFTSPLNYPCVIAFSYLKGIYGFAVGNKSGIYKPVNI